jgi:hypothetical protein
MTLTATCADCDKAWRGPHAHERGLAHDKEAQHVVWFDEDEDTTEDDWEGMIDAP